MVIIFAIFFGLVVGYFLADILRKHAPSFFGRKYERESELPLLKQDAILIRHHHEKYDGTGYPDRIKGQQIELGARILAVADAFDSMTTDRPYRKAISAEESLGRLEKCKGSQFDPRIIEHLKEIITKQPDIMKPL